MFRSGIVLSLAVVVVCGSSRFALAQKPEDARWVWFDEGNPAEKAAPGKVWFRKEYRAGEPSTGLALVVSDDAFTLWVNGEKIGEGTGNKLYRFNLSGNVGRGLNVFAVEASNKEGKAGLFIAAEIRGQSGGKIPCNTGAEWKATRESPKGDGWLKEKFDDSSWKAVKDLGPHATSPWKELSLALGELDRFQVPEGFELKRVAGPGLAGSLVNITWGNRGRLIVSKQDGPIYSLIDEDGDGTYDKAIEYTGEIKHAQGLCVVGDVLYAVGTGPKGAGLYRLPDANADDKADEIVLLTAHKGGMGEHGPHAVVLGPDGWLYHCLGNHSWIQNTPEATSPARNYEEGYLLRPGFEDAGGHAVGIKAPGGTIWRFSPDGTKWWQETVGFRNQYDIAFNSAGDLFTFDSDMEWDVNLPWYKPVRVNHCIPGAEFGWRSGAINWPEYYFDCLPGTINVGRGSPTGVVFYEHLQFPEKYRGAMLNCDWSMGRLIAGHLKRSGASYSGTFDNLVSGNPLNVSDVEVAPDGSVLFCTGGRGTEGGVYRVSYVAGNGTLPKFPKAETLDDALHMPQLHANWAREAIAGIKAKLGDKWETGLAGKVKTGTPAEKIRALTLLAQLGPQPEESLILAACGDKDASVRQFGALLLGSLGSIDAAGMMNKLLADSDPTVQRRACEALVRSGVPGPPAQLVKLLGHPDRWVRFAARIAIERVEVEGWKSLVLTSDNADVVINGLYALTRMGPNHPPTREIGDKLASLFANPQRSAQQRIDLRRLFEVLLIADKDGSIISPEAKKHLGQIILHEFSLAQGVPANREQAYPVDREAAQLVAWLQVPGAAQALMTAIEQTNDRDAKIHYALCLRYLNEGWTLDLKRRYLDWYESSRDIEGGNSLQGYLRNIVVAGLDRYTPEERKRYILTWKERPHAARMLVSASQPEQVKDFEQVIAALLAEIEAQPGGGGQELFALAIDGLSKSKAEASQALLRKMFDENADRRDLLARGLAKNPVAENVPYLLRGVASSDGTTAQVCLQAISDSKYKAEKPAEIRTVIVAGLKLGRQGGMAAANLLQKWTGSEHGQRRNPEEALAHYQKWFTEKYPDEPAPEVAKENTEKTKYTVAQLVDFLENNPAGRAGDVAKGKALFAKTNCIKCHKFGPEGEGVGPDLTAVRRRFQKKEILEAILLPSQVTSDQYQAWTVATKGGLVHTGMPLPNPGSKKLLLLLPDATKLEIAEDDIDEKVKAKTSVMPEGLLKDLSLPDIADLFAFLETSKNNAEPVKAAGK